MKVVEIHIKSVHEVLAAGAVVAKQSTREVTVNWHDHRNEVIFNISGDRFDLEAVRCDNSRERVWMSTEWKDLPKDHRRLVLAAAIKLRLKGFFLNKEFIVMEREPVRSEPVRVLELVVVEEEAKPVRHESNWKGVGNYGISGHRKETRQPTVSVGATMIGLGLALLGSNRR